MKRLVQDVLARWVAFCEHQPGMILLTIVLLTVTAGVYVFQNFAIDSDLGKLIRPSGDLGWYQANEDYKAAFPELQQTSVVVVSGSDLSLVDNTGRRLLSAFRADGGFESVFAPALDPFLRDRRAYFLTREALEDWISGIQYDYGALLRLADGADLTNVAFTLADQVAATNGLRLPTPLASIAENFSGGVPQRISVKGYPHLEPDVDEHYLIIILQGQLIHNQQLPTAVQVALIESLIAESTPDPGVRVRLTGEVPLAHEEISAAMDGIGIAGTVSLLLLAVILSVGVRSWRIVAGTFALLGVGVVLTLAFGIATVGSFNTLALIFVVMFFGLGVDFAVHFSLRLWESKTPAAMADPEVSAVRDIGPALLLCMLTSSIAFLAFAPTDYRGLAELGIISAGGMVLAFLLTVTLMPAFFALVGLPQPPQMAARRSRSIHLQPGLTLGLALIVAIVAAWIGRDLRFDYSVLALRDADTEAMSTLLELQDNQITTDYSINVLAADGADAQHLKTRLESLETVGEVLIASDLVPLDQTLKQGALQELATLLETIDPVQPVDATISTAGLGEAIDYLAEVRSKVQVSDRALFDRFLSGLEELRREPGRRQLLDEQIRRGLEEELAALRRLVQVEPFELAALPEDLRARLVAKDGRQLVTVMPARPIAGREATEAFVQSVLEVTPNVAGRAVVEWGVGDVAVRAFVEAVVLALTAIVVLLVVYFRGVVLPVVVLMPLVLTTLITFALLELFGLSLNMANILVIPLVFGLGVDTGIHVVHRFTEGADVNTLMASSTSRAVIISGLTTIGTFFSLSFSPHKGAASVGLLLTIAISVMLLVTFWVVPALLQLLQRRAPR